MLGTALENDSGVRKWRMRYGDKKEILRELKNICFEEARYSSRNKFCNFGCFILYSISTVPIFVCKTSIALILNDIFLCFTTFRKL